MSPKSRGLIAGSVVLALAFPWVNSEWKGGWLQALGGAALIAIPVGLATRGLADRSRRGAQILKGLLVLAVLLSLAGVYSYGLFTTPWLIAPLWLATNRARGAEALVWIALAIPCALVTGLLLSSSWDRSDHLIAIVFTGLVIVLFAGTAFRNANALAVGEGSSG